MMPMKSRTMHSTTTNDNTCMMPITTKSLSSWRKEASYGNVSQQHEHQESSSYYLVVLSYDNGDYVWCYDDRWRRQTRIRIVKTSSRTTTTKELLTVTNNSCSKRKRRDKKKSSRTSPSHHHHHDHRHHRYYALSNRPVRPPLCRRRGSDDVVVAVVVVSLWMKSVS